VAQAMPDWTDATPLRVVTGYHGVARRFFAEQGFRHVQLLSAVRTFNLPNNLDSE